MRYQGVTGRRARSPSPAYLEMLSNIQPATLTSPPRQTAELPDFDEADANADGVIDLDEFKKVWPAQ